MTEGRVSRRRNPTIIPHNSRCSFLLSSSTFVIEDPGSLVSFCHPTLSPTLVIKANEDPGSLLFLCLFLSSSK